MADTAGGYCLGGANLRQWAAQLGAIGTDAKAARDGVMDMKMNHLAHLQTGIEQVAKSNDTAVEILREIKTGITVLTDRFPRA